MTGNEWRNARRPSDIAGYEHRERSVVIPDLAQVTPISDEVSEKLARMEEGEEPDEASRMEVERAISELQRSHMHDDLMKSVRTKTRYSVREKIIEALRRCGKLDAVEIVNIVQCSSPYCRQMLADLVELGIVKRHEPPKGAVTTKRERVTFTLTQHGDSQ